MVARCRWARTWCAALLRSCTPLSIGGPLCSGPLSLGGTLDDILCDGLVQLSDERAGRVPKPEPKQEMPVHKSGYPLRRNVSAPKVTHPGQRVMPCEQTSLLHEGCNNGPASSQQWVYKVEHVVVVQRITPAAPLLYVESHARQAKYAAAQRSAKPNLKRRASAGACSC